MTREEFDKLYLGKVVHCNTKEKANHFLALADSVGYRWFSGCSLIKTNLWETGEEPWEGYEEETCYRITKEGILLQNRNYFIRRGYQIIKYRLQPKFKVGDKVRVKNTLKVGVIERVGSLRQIPYAINFDGCVWHLFLSENDLEKVEEPTNEEETTESIIDEIKEYQERITVLLNRLEQEMKK